ncbi:MAG: hypothetical protein NUK54_10665, partial [Methanothrix sp.]|nr:hypothetical protein [Methanothrix sp.]
DTGSWGILKDDGTVAIASTSAFSLDVKDVINADLVRAKDLVKASDGSVSDAPRIYYVDDPYLYRVIAYDFDRNFDLNLFVPNCTVHGAILSVTGSDLATRDKFGQRYWIDGNEVSGCDAVKCGGWRALRTDGVSCVPQKCEEYKDELYVKVAPVNIADKITPGIRRLAARGIDNRHILTIRAVTSITDEEMLLYSDDIKIQISETRSSPMIALYELIVPSEQADNTTMESLGTISTS